MRTLARAAFLIFFSASLASTASTQDTPAPVASVAMNYTQVTRPVVEITDTSVIRFLLFELFIDPLESPSRLQFIDVTLNGYGSDDLIVAFPTMEAFLVPGAVPDSVQKLMSGWVPKSEFRLDAGNLPSAALAALIASDADVAQRAENSILSEVVQAVERNYRDLPMGLLFQRDSVGFTFQLWDYERSSMVYTPRPSTVSDSAVRTVVTLLKDIGYVPERGGAEARVAGRMVSVAQALNGIREVTDDVTRLLAMRTILVGTYDLDRSGTIDGGRESDGVPCDVWSALEGSVPGGLSEERGTESLFSFSAANALGIADAARAEAGRRVDQCLGGTRSSARAAGAVGDGAEPVRRAAPLPSEVTAYLGMEASAEIVERAGARPAGSASWATEVRRVLLSRFDSDRSGAIDRAVELAAVPCPVWQALTATNTRLVVGLGFDGASAYAGDRIGIAPGMRVPAHSRLERCVIAAEARVARRVRPAASASGTTGASLTASSPVAALRGVRFLPEEEKQLAVRTIIVAFYDANHSGYVDSPSELDAITCDVWGSVAEDLPVFAETFGFALSTRGQGQPFQWSLLLNVSEALAEPAARRVVACRNGATPPPTAGGVVASDRGVQLPAAVAYFLDVASAVRIARLVTRFEPGSASWAAAVRSVLVEEYDFDGSGILDSTTEVAAVPCVVWSTVRATFGAGMRDLGLGGDGRFLADRIGIGSSMKAEASRRLETCGVVSSAGGQWGGPTYSVPPFVFIQVARTLA